jgi:hypothetical protein
MTVTRRITREDRFALHALRLEDRGLHDVEQREVEHNIPDGPGLLDFSP